MSKRGEAMKGSKQYDQQDIPARSTTSHLRYGPVLGLPPEDVVPGEERGVLAGGVGQVQDHGYTAERNKNEPWHKV